MNKNIIFCSDPYTQSAEEYYGTDYENMIVSIPNLNQLIEDSIKDFFMSRSINVLVKN